MLNLLENGLEITKKKTATFVSTAIIYTIHTYSTILLQKEDKDKMYLKMLWSEDYNL